MVGLVGRLDSGIADGLSRLECSGWLTLNEALYGIPIGRLANTAKTLLARGERKARLCEISWIARKRFWFAVAPMI